MNICRIDCLACFSNVFLILGVDFDDTVIYMNVLLRRKEDGAEKIAIYFHQYML